MARRLSCLLCGLVALSARGAFAQASPAVTPVLSTAPLFSYEDAPATPDADDPAIWPNRQKFIDFRDTLKALLPLWAAP